MRVKNQSNNVLALHSLNVNPSKLVKTGINRYGHAKGWFLPDWLEVAFITARENIIRDNHRTYMEEHADEIALEELKYDLAESANESGLMEGKDFHITWDGRLTIYGIRKSKNVIRRNSR